MERPLVIKHKFEKNNRDDSQSSIIAGAVSSRQLNENLYAGTNTGRCPLVTGNLSPETRNQRSEVRGQKSEARNHKQEIRREIKEFVLNHRGSNDLASTHDDEFILELILSFLLPPLAVYLHYDDINDFFWIDLILTLLLWIPGVIFALLVITDTI